MPSALKQIKIHRHGLRPLRSLRVSRRCQSTVHAQPTLEAGTTSHIHRASAPSIPLARLPTSSILRSLFLSAFFTSPLLFRPGFAIFRAIANSNSPLLNPDRNPLLRSLIRPLVYDQFCAGTNRAEVHKTSTHLKRLGFSGVALGYARELPFGRNGDAATMVEDIDRWRDGNFKTLDILERGDIIGMKYSGAGPAIIDALLEGRDPPERFAQAIETICEKAAAKGCRVWIDAEQQAVQTTIDDWTVDLMRRFNKLGKPALINNTVQAYLKSSRDTVRRHLQLAQAEGWRLGIKLVRGAYIRSDTRSKIHDTKAETDDSYNSIARDLLHGNFSAGTGKAVECDLLLAGHNSHSIRTALKTATELAASSNLKVRPDFGQLHGMADDIGCEILQVAEDVQRAQPRLPATTFAPQVYKSMQWGSLQECMQFMTRRLVENEGAANRMLTGNAEFRGELWRRLRMGFRGQ